MKNDARRVLAPVAWRPGRRPRRSRRTAGDAKIVLIAGTPSHGPGEHEFNAGMKLLVKCLKEVPGDRARLRRAAAGPRTSASSTGPSRSSSSWTAAAATR